TRSADLYKRIWADDPLVQLGSPIGGMVRGSARIAALSERLISESPVRVQTVLEDIVAYESPDLVVFTERERGTYTRERAQDELEAHHCRSRDLVERSRWHFLWLLACGLTATAAADVTGYSAYWIGQIARRES